MRSKTSFFNKTLFRKDLSRFWPLWGGASFLGALVPLAFLSELLRSGYRDYAPLEMTEMYYSVLAFAVPIISLLYSVLCALAVWSYLYNARSVGMMHTLPIRREGLFATSFLAGMAMLLIPYAVTGALCVAVTSSFGLFEPVGLLVTILGVLGESFFYFASATAVAFVTGNIFAMPALYLLLHFLEPVSDWLLSRLGQHAIFGVSTYYTGTLEFLSPTVYLIRNLGIDTERVLVEEGFDSRYMAVSIRLTNGWIIAAYAVLGAALLAVAFALYRRRMSERAGEVVAVGWMRPIFRYGVTALAALGGGQFLYGIFMGSDGNMAVMALCMLVAGTIGYYIASMLLARSLRVFRGSLRGLALSAAGIVLLCAGLRFDALDIAGRVPEVGELSSVELSVAGNSYTFTPDRDADTIEQLRAVHTAIASDRDYVRNFYRDGVSYRDDEHADEGRERRWDTTPVYLRYTLRNGRAVERRYILPITRARLAQPETYDELLDSLVRSPALRARRLHLDDGYQPDGGSLYANARDQGFDLSDREAAAILAAVSRDADRGTWGTYDWFGQDDGEDLALDLELTFLCKTDDYTSRDWITIRVRPEMTETVDCLLSLGLVEREDLVTYQELYAKEEVPVSTVSPEAAAVLPTEAAVLPERAV